MRDDALALVKLGGAAITDKRSTRALDARGLADGARAIAAVARAGARVVLAHGAGSFGHGARVERAREATRRARAHV